MIRQSPIGAPAAACIFVDSVRAAWFRRPQKMRTRLNPGERRISGRSRRCRVPPDRRPIVPARLQRFPSKAVDNAKIGFIQRYQVATAIGTQELEKLLLVRPLPADRAGLPVLERLVAE